ncbi:MAG TPA: hypothetical protein VHW46_02495 [Terracidiphilus sp.]|nr:hypothetical protein [Terracidiphilus sp.]
MNDAGKLPEDLRKALDTGVLRRLPATFLPFVNQQLHQWEFLFGNEQESVRRLVLYVDRLSPAASAVLFRDITRLEEKMDVKHWHLSTSEQTIQNSSELARSPYFQQWRQAVQAVFDAADRDALRKTDSEGPEHRLILIDIPAALLLRRETAWRRWQGTGKTIDLDVSSQGDLRRGMQLLVNGAEDRPGILRSVARRAKAAPGNVWVLDAGDDLAESIMEPRAAGSVHLSYPRLNAFRESFSHAMNSMRKDLSDADAVFDRLRTIDVTSWCPSEVAEDAATREFVRALYLSGNGAVIFSNSFVEWGASEAFRRARPLVLTARFGVRAKPKAFTGVAVFDNPDTVNPTPSTDDLAGSAQDAEMLAWYVWLSAARYPEYQSSTVCLCVAESLAQAYLIAPGDFELAASDNQVSIGNLQEALNRWVA